MSEPRRDEHDDDRTATNVMLVLAFILLVGSGLWLAEAMRDARRADECLSAGRRHCSLIAVPAE